EQQARALDAAEPPHDPFERIHRPVEHRAPDLDRVPLEPEEDLLLFIAEHSPYLADWQKDLLHIVHEEARHSIPQIDTKIMNEGWASYWHHKIMNSLDLPEELHLEFLVHHNQVIRAHPGGLNPYYIGFRLWHDIRRRYDEPTEAEIEAHGTPDKSGMEKIFEVRETDRDVSFLRRFLTADLMRDMDLFEYAKKGDRFVVSNVSDEEHWREVKETLLRNIGMNTVPVIRILDADHDHNRTLYTRHEHDGRDLQYGSLEKTLRYLHRLWGRRVLLETVMQGKSTTFSCDEDGVGRSAG
ncbi:MAG TPA: stage V sporulation protein R, partial [Chromatiales bacterium]|nr:stage V sporulation protein R [Chromatiales bacterium]